ncbi:hypothetical protein ACTHPF_00755 [Paenibacillus sp. SAF-054]|uniref:hypothetical protein n=1 Tax=unclassified Paenibacillus TaxID=185978 RepID=UPI003F812744
MNLRKTANIRIPTRKLLLASISAAVVFALSSPAQAEPVQAPPEMLSYAGIQLPEGAVFEHGDNQIRYAAIGDGQVRISVIGAYGQIMPIASFAKHKLEFISSIQRTADQGFVIAGGPVAVKFAASGKPEWEYDLSSAAPTGTIRSAIQLKDGSIIAAVTEPGDMPNASKLCLVQLAASGKVIKETELSGVLFDNVGRLLTLSDGGFVLAGEAFMNEGKEQILVAKWDKDLKTVWQKRFEPAEDTENLWITALSEGSDGALGLSGYYNHPNPDGGYRYLTTGYAISLQQDGALKWINKPDPSLERSMLNDIQPVPGGGFIATGTVNQDWHGTVSKQWVWKLGEHGDTLWSKAIERTTFNSGLFVQPLRNMAQQDAALLIGTADGEDTLIKIGYLNSR